MSDNERKLRSGGTTSAVSLDKTKKYKLNSAGSLVEATTEGDTDIIFSGSKSSLRRIADLERNVSILAARTQTEDGSGDGSGSGTVEKANKLATSRTISLTGDVTGSASFDGSANASITATIAANSVALGTDTTGNYVASLVAGTGITLTNNTGESATPTVAVDTSTIATQSWVTTQIATKDNTDEITEGATNLYFTNARARGAVSASTGLSYNSSTGAFSIDSTVATLTGTQTLTNKTLTSPVVTGLVLNDGSIVVEGTTADAFETTLTFADPTGDATVTVPNITGTLITTGDNGTVTNAMLAGSIGNGKLTNSSVTIGTTAISLGSSSTTLAGLTSVTSTAFTGSLSGNATTATTATNLNGGSVQATTGTFSSSTASTSTSTGAVVVTGGVGIGGKLNVGGAAAVTGALTATGEITAYFSDKRLKENIKPIENALAKTLQLHGVTYNANDVAASFGYTSKAAQVGLLAQDVKAVLPEVIAPAPFDVKVVDGKEVSKSGEDYITVKYEKIVALLVEAIKELNDKVESLEAQLGGSKSL